MFTRKGNKWTKLLLGMVLISAGSVFCLAQEEKPEDGVREKLLSDESLLFFAPFDFSVDAEKAHRNKVGTLGGEGEFVEGVVGNSLSLPASGKGTVAYDFRDNINFKEAGTLMFWFKPYWWGDDTSGNRSLLWIRLSNRRYYALYRSFHAPAPTDLYAIIKGFGERISTRHWKKDEWVHLAFTWDAATFRYIGYVNGKPAFISTMRWLVKYEDEPLEPKSLILGRYYVSDIPIDAAYDEFYVFGRALSKEEIMGYYNETRPQD